MSNLRKRDIMVIKGFKFKSLDDKKMNSASSLC